MAGSTTSDLNGDFTLSAVPPGMQLLVIDSTTAQSAPDSSAYASFQEEITLIADVTNIIDRPALCDHQNGRQRKWRAGAAFPAILGLSRSRALPRSAQKPGNRGGFRATGPGPQV